LKKLEKKVTFFDLPAREKKKIIKLAIKGANKDQRELIGRYKSKIDKLEFVSCN